MKKGTDDHPKTHDLCEELHINVAWACGILELLWAFTRDYAPAGDVGRFSDAAIARACHWTKKPELLIAALVNNRWLDRSDKFRLVIHDWADHCDDYTRKKLKRSGQEFCSVLEKSGPSPESVRTNSRQFSTHARAEPVPVPEPVPEPPPEPVPISAAAAAVETVQAWLEEFTGGEWGRPDFRVAEQILFAIDGAPLEDWGRYLLSLRDRRQRPEKSWAWFVTVTKSGFANWRRTRGNTAAD